MSRALGLVLAIGMAVPSLPASTPGRDLAVAAAGHAPGAGGSFWKSDLQIVNPGAMAVDLTVSWLPRGTDNGSPASTEMMLEAGATVLLEDLVAKTFGVESAFGALRIQSSGAVIASSRIFNDQGTAGTLGQGFDAEPVERALGVGETTWIPGLRSGDDFRTNLGALDVSGDGSRLRFDLLDASGAVLASGERELAAWEPMLEAIEGLAGGVVGATSLRAEVLAGRALVFASVVDGRSGDAATLSAASRGDAVEGSYAFRLADSLGTAGGGRLLIRDGRIVELELGYLNLDVVDGLGEPACATLFPVSLTPGIEPAELASGLSWQQAFDQPAGVLDLSLRLEAEHGLGFSGTLEVTGADFSGQLAGCNGDHPPLQITAGKSIASDG